MLNYMDNPYEVEKWIESLTDKERDIFDKGYAIAVHGVLEQISDLKRVAMNKFMGLDPDKRKDKTLDTLYAQLQILEILERHYTRRIHNLTRDLA